MSVKKGDPEMMTTTKTYTVTKKDGTTKTVESPYSVSELLEKLSKLSSSFAQDLARKGEKWGLSEKQLAWGHILVIESETPSTKPEGLPEGTFSGLIEMLTRVRESGTKYPKVRLATEGGGKVVLALAGPKSKHAGAINVTDGRPYGDNDWYGRIELDGSMVTSRKLTFEILDLLRAFESDPSGVGASLGKLTGTCVFCGKDLDTKESVGAGYGPVCAKKYGLPWGAATAANYEEMKKELLPVTKVDEGELTATKPDPKWDGSDDDLPSYL